MEWVFPFLLDRYLEVYGKNGNFMFSFLRNCQYVLPSAIYEDSLLRAKIQDDRDFPGDPVVKTALPMQGTPGRGTKTPHAALCGLRGEKYSR